MYLIIVYKTRAKLRKKERNTKQTVRFFLEKKRRIDSDIKKYVKQALFLQFCIYKEALWYLKKKCFQAR